ncbi:helix-turn-helix domain-containing protein [Rubinisphaera sp.]|uniref:helix-turn-helix domain-containing protein n=1 Tax=Rubinisphaera sp. TaxID=2024857 RepID=UPI0025DF1DA9|nr:helix-turn-helix domain-containing protein [Rubinisphaera sp.]
MIAIATVRIVWNIQNLLHQGDDQYQISLSDYMLTRDLLINLPLPQQYSNLSPQSLETAEVLYEQFEANVEYQKSIPDNSDLGRKVFTRQAAADSTGLSYNTIKSHLSCLEQNGIIESRVVSASKRHSLNRGQGRQIYFIFQKSRAPPFTNNNPFSLLPTPDEFAKD